AQLVDQRADSRPGDDGVAVQGNLDRADETTRTEPLGYEAVGAGPDRSEQRLLVEIGRDYENRRGGCALRNATHSEDATAGDPEIDEDEPGSVELRRLGRARRIGHIGGDHEARTLEHAAPRGANKRP